MTTKTEILKAIRQKCLDCSVYQPMEVRLCPVEACDLWIFRHGKDPNPARKHFQPNSTSTDDDDIHLESHLAMKGAGLT